MLLANKNIFYVGIFYFQLFSNLIKSFLIDKEYCRNQAEYRNRGNYITGLQTNRIYCHINGLKKQGILITRLEHVLMVKPLIYEILLICHKWHQIFQASKRFSRIFDKHG